jgi:hypothetical protein
MGDPAHGLRCRIQQKFQPAFMEAHDRPCDIASRVHARIYGGAHLIMTLVTSVTEIDPLPSRESLLEVSFFRPR